MLKLTFVGDIFPANLSYSRNCGVASLNLDDNHRGEYVRQIKKIIGNDSMFIGNLESPILPIDSFSKEMQFAGHPDFIKLLMESGIDLVSIANNHILEHHIDGLESTKHILDNNHIPYIGTYEKNGKPKVAIVEKDGFRLAFVAYNDIDNQKYEKGKICEYTFEGVKNDIGELKKQDFDYIFTILHWGDEYIHRPSTKQIIHAKAFIDAGANFVICSHPHVIQPVEEYHSGLICYSLGNFVFDMTIPKSAKIGMVVEIELSKDDFKHQERFVKLETNFFPLIIKKDQKIRDLLYKQKQMMIDYQSPSYPNQYEKEKRRKRLQKRIAEKYLLFKNWRKYTPSIRHEFLNYYLNIFKYGKN